MKLEISSTFHFGKFGLQMQTMVYLWKRILHSTLVLFYISSYSQYHFMRYSAKSYHLNTSNRKLLLANHIWRNTGILTGCAAHKNTRTPNPGFHNQYNRKLLECTVKIANESCTCWSTWSQFTDKINMDNYIYNKMCNQVLTWLNNQHLIACFTIPIFNDVTTNNQSERFSGGRFC